MTESETSNGKSEQIKNISKQNHSKFLGGNIIKRPTLFWSLLLATIPGTVIGMRITSGISIAPETRVTAIVPIAYLIFKIKLYRHKRWAAKEYTDTCRNCATVVITPRNPYCQVCNYSTLGREQTEK